jgi:DUF1365 family protein
MSAVAHALIGEGRVWHRRLQPVEHAFAYGTMFLLLPMRSLRTRPCPALRRNRLGALAFFDRDHGEGGEDALAWFDGLLAAEGIHDARGEVWLHTFPRVLGHVFNPASFWYAHRLDGSLAAVVAEVNNTFGERHCYLLAGPHVRWGAPLEADKVFAVSPFCTVEGRYRFCFELSRDDTDTPQHSRVRIDLDGPAGPILQTCVSGSLQPFTIASARRSFMKAPLHAAGVVSRIHWQALRLALKRAPFHRRPLPPDHFVSR